MKNNIHSKTRFTSLAIGLILLSGTATIAQVTPTPTCDSVNISDVSALFSADGISFYNQTPFIMQYRVPKTGPANSIFAAGLWIGGLDMGGHLHTSVETYRQLGNDFWPGPIMDSVDYSPHQDTIWNKVWKVNKSTIDSFKLGQCVGIPASIANWPGNGNVTLGEADKLAPFIDVNQDGIYNPADGDYPDIRGDQALFMIFNDARKAHGGADTGGIKLGVEVHLMAYQYNVPADTAVYQTTFLHYDVFNRSANKYDSVYLGYYCDMEIGNGSNDYIGCDSAGDYWYGYNGTATDPNGSGNYAGEFGYGGPTPPPPAQSVAYLCDTMTHFIYYTNDFSGTGNPDHNYQYYNYMKSVWRDGSHMNYGGTGFHSSASNANFMYTGNPATSQGWSMVSTNAVPNDMRGVSSVGPFTLKPDSNKTMDLALVFSRANTGNQNTSVTTLHTAVQNVRNFYNTQGYICDEVLDGTATIPASHATALLYPNPISTSGTLLVSGKDLKDAQLQVYDVLGRQVLSQSNIHNNNITINRGNLQTGIYFYRLSQNGEMLVNGKFIIQ